MWGVQLGRGETHWWPLQSPRKLRPPFLFAPPNSWSCQAKSTGQTPQALGDCREKGLRNFIPQHPQTPARKHSQLLTTMPTITHFSNPPDSPAGGTTIIPALIRAMRKSRHREVRPPAPGHTAGQPSLNQAGSRLLTALGFVCLSVCLCVV